MVLFLQIQLYKALLFTYHHNYHTEKSSEQQTQKPNTCNKQKLSDIQNIVCEFDVTLQV